MLGVILRLSASLKALTVAKIESKFKEGDIIKLNERARKYFKHRDFSLRTKILRIELRYGNPLLHLSVSLTSGFRLDESWAELATPRIDLSEIYT